MVDARVVVFSVVVVSSVVAIVVVERLDSEPGDPFESNSDQPPMRSRIRTSGCIPYWCYKIQKVSWDEQELLNSQYDMVVLEPTRTDYGERGFDAKSFVNELKNSYGSDGSTRKIVLAYIDIGEAEDWRWYFPQSGLSTWNSGPPPSDWPSYIVAKDPDGWEGNYPVKYWSSEWKDITIYGMEGSSNLAYFRNGCCKGSSEVFDSILDEVIKDGFDGIYLDWVEAWEMTEVQQAAVVDGVDPAHEMIKFIQEMRDYASSRGLDDFIIVQQNSASLAQTLHGSELLTIIDAIAQEGIFWEGDATDNWENQNGYDDKVGSGQRATYLNDLQVYKDAGLTVFNCEYALTKAEDAYTKSYQNGLIPYVTRRSLSQLTTTPPPTLESEPFDPNDPRCSFTATSSPSLSNSPPSVPTPESSSSSSPSLSPSVHPSRNPSPSPTLSPSSSPSSMSPMPTSSPSSSGIIPNPSTSSTPTENPFPSSFAIVLVAVISLLM